MTVWEGLKLHVSKGSKSGYMGVKKHNRLQHKKYQARYQLTSLGYYSSAVEAAVAYANHVMSVQKSSSCEGAQAGRKTFSGCIPDIEAGEKEYDESGSHVRTEFSTGLSAHFKDGSGNCVITYKEGHPDQGSVDEVQDGRVVRTRFTTGRRAGHIYHWDVDGLHPTHLTFDAMHKNHGRVIYYTNGRPGPLQSLTSCPAAT